VGKRIAVIGAAALAVGLAMADRSASAEPWRADQVIAPAALARVLTSGHGTRPVLLYVGFPLLYAGGHIPGSVYVGPTMRPEGIEALKGAVQKLPKDADVVIYCGCCPMERCPNVRPAFRLMKELGFTDVKVLDIPVNLPRDWTAKGYPTEKGSPSP
jgi:rhodanese-related sulfurtransferase